MLEYGQVVEFNKAKYFRYIKPLGSGGTGDTYLFEDETTETLFAFKKYAPKEGNDIEENYARFVQEVKILFNISHKNIVRIYSHYLFPRYKTGFLQMEYVEGTHISNFSPYPGREWNDIFYDVVEAFNYLEKHNILHRDIRAENLLVDANGDVKIIDFGFGKKLNSTEASGGSIFLNWPVSGLPQEIAESGSYSHKTEIFFVGKLFSSLILSKGAQAFRYAHIVEKMCQQDPNSRFSSFRDIIDDISKGEFATLRFTQEAKRTFQNFANGLVNAIAHLKGNLCLERDSYKILSSLSEALRVSCFENEIQDNKLIIGCFLSQGYGYFNPPSSVIAYDTVQKFYDLFSGLPLRERQVVLDNLQVRLEKVKIFDENRFDDVPF